MRRSYALVGLIMLFWFVISFITNIIGPLIPDIIDNFHLQHLALAGFIPTSFFVAYGIMSIPSGLLIERFSQKTVLTALRCRSSGRCSSPSCRPFRCCWPRRSPSDWAWPCCRRRSTR